MDSEELRKVLPEKELLVLNGKRIGIIHGSGPPWGSKTESGNVLTSGCHSLRAYPPGKK